MSYHLCFRSESESPAYRLPPLVCSRIPSTSSANALTPFTSGARRASGTAQPGAASTPLGATPVVGTSRGVSQGGTGANSGPPSYAARGLATVVGAGSSGTNAAALAGINLGRAPTAPVNAAQASSSDRTETGNYASTSEAAKAARRTTLVSFTPNSGRESTGAESHYSATQAAVASGSQHVATGGVSGSWMGGGRPAAFFGRSQDKDSLRLEEGMPLSGAGAGANNGTANSIPWQSLVTQSNRHSGGHRRTEQSSGIFGASLMRRTADNLDVLRAVWLPPPDATLNSWRHSPCFRSQCRQNH